jgi:hypothetical protein
MCEMTNGQLDKPVYQLPMPLEGVDEAIQGEVLSPREAAFAALSVLRVKEPIFETVRERDEKSNKVVEREVKIGERETAPRWMELFQKLHEGGWRWEVAVYIAWRSMPKKYRYPETQDELAKRCLGLNSDRAIATWRKRNPFIDEYITILQGELVFDRIPDILDAMTEVAATPDYKGNADRKLALEMTGRYTPSSKITAEMAKKLVNSRPDDLEDLSDEELRKIEETVAFARKQKNEESAE